MATITPANALYLYQLFSKSVGVGRQAPLAEFEQALADDGILATDLGCDDLRSLLEGFDFIRLSVFKRGRVYATVLSRPEWDELLEREAATDEKETSARGHKAWKRKRSNKALRPERPRIRRHPKRKAPADDTASKPTAVNAESTKAEASFDAAEEPQDTPPLAVEGQSPEQQTPIAEEASPKAVTTQAESTAAQAPHREEVPLSDDEQTDDEKDSVVTSASEDVQSIRLTVTYAPPMQNAHMPSMAPNTAPAVAGADQPPIPSDFMSDVWCPTNTLSALYQLLPLDISPLSILAEDWRYASSTEGYRITPKGIVFPLHVLRAPASTPIEVHVHRTAPTASGKRWQLASIEGPVSRSIVDFRGLPAADEGAWSDLLGLPRGTYFSTSPLREFTQFAELGPWQPLLSQLATLAQPEPWGHELVGLREYLAVTFHRLAHERKIVTSRDGQFAAFDTGLLTPYAQRIFANFVANDSIVPWRLNGFSTHSNVQPVPEPATYVCELQHFMLMEPCTVRLGRTLRKQEAARIASDAGMTLESQVEKSVVRARRSYRMVTPAYDPQAEEMRLLLPLALEVPNMVDQALVLEALDCAEGDAAHQGPRYEAKAILSLERARTCARAVSAELPSWLG